MKVTPLGSYHQPDYPTQKGLQQEPRLLVEPPRRWSGNRIVLSALAAAVALLNQSCANHSLHRKDWARTRGAPRVPQFVPEDEAKARSEHRSDGKQTQPPSLLR